MNATYVIEENTYVKKKNNVLEMISAISYIQNNNNKHK